MTTLSADQEELLERRRRGFSEFVSEMQPALETLGRAIWSHQTDLLMRDPVAALPRMEELLANDDLMAVPEEELSPLRVEIMFYIASLFMQRYGGEWRIVEDVNSPWFARYVLSGFSKGASPDGVIEPGAIMDTLTRSPAPRSLIAAIDAVDWQLSASRSR